MQITFLTRKSALIYRRGLRQRVASLTLNCNGDFAIRAYGCLCMLLGTYVGRNLWICAIHGSACAICGSIVCAEIHGCLRNLWILRMMQIISHLGLYRDVWIAANASSTTSLATRTAAICVRFQGRRVRRVYVTMQITFLTRKSALIYRRGLRQRVASLTLNCNGDFAIRAYGCLCMLLGTYVGRNLWICAIHGSACAICGSIVCAEIHGCLRNLWILRMMQIISHLGLYRDVWIAANASSTTSLATRTAAICVRFQGRRVRRVYVTMQITFLTRKSALIYRRGLRQRVASLTLNCNGDFAIRAYGCLCMLLGTYVGRNLWICAIHGSACAICGSIVCAEIHGCLRNLWILRMMQIISHLGLYRDVWIAANASSTTSLATRTAAICVRFQGRRVRRVYVTMQITFLTRKSALIYRRGLRQRVASLTLNCNGDFAIRAYGCLCMLLGTYVGRNLWICAIHGSACAICGSIVCAEIHGCLRNLWILRMMQIISHLGLYRDVWIAANASSTTSLATRTAAICVRFQGRRVRRVYVTMQITFLTRKSALIYRRGLRQRVASLTLNCNGDFAIRAYGCLCMLLGTYVGRNLWICAIHGSACAICGSIVCAEIHGCLRNLWILRRMQIISHLGLYRDVWIAAIASSTTRLATRTAAICVRFQGRRVRRVYVTMQITFLTRKSALIYRRGLRQRVASLTLNCNGDFAIRAYGCLCMLLGTYVGRNLWICAIHGSACAICGSIVCAEIHGCLRNLWILRRMQIISHLGLYRDVWIAAIASSTTRLATRTAAICVRFQGRRVRRVYVTMQITFLTRKSALIYRRGLHQRVASLTLNCNIWRFRDKSL